MVEQRGPFAALPFRSAGISCRSRWPWHHRYTNVVGEKDSLCVQFSSYREKGGAASLRVLVERSSGILSFGFATDGVSEKAAETSYYADDDKRGCWEPVLCAGGGGGGERKRDTHSLRLRADYALCRFVPLDTIRFWRALTSFGTYRSPKRLETFGRGPSYRVTLVTRYIPF